MHAYKKYSEQVIVNAVIVHQTNISDTNGLPSVCKVFIIIWLGGPRQLYLPSISYSLYCTHTLYIEEVKHQDSGASVLYPYTGHNQGYIPGFRIASTVPIHCTMYLHKVIHPGSGAPVLYPHTVHKQGYISGFRGSSTVPIHCT